MTDQNVKTFTDDAQYRNDLLNAKTAQDISDASARLMQRQSGVQRDATTGRFVSPDADTNSAGDTFTQTIEVNGLQVEIEGTSAEDLAVKVDIARQTAAALAAGSQKSQAELEAEAETERQRQQVAQAQLDIDYRAGRVDTATYLQQSGAVRAYLESEGISVEQLRADAEARQGASLVQSWQQATEQFLAKSDWPGGEKNKAQMQTVLAALDLLDAGDKVGALQQAYDYMKQQGTIFPPEETEAQALDSLVKTRFGVDVKDATPQQLLEVWKQQQENIGTGDASKANQAFIDSFRRRG